jgi:hypothetical protein
MVNGMLLRRLIAAALVGVSVHANARVQAKAEITQVQLTVVDLTPDDGLAPSITTDLLGQLWYAVASAPSTAQMASGALGQAGGISVSDSNAAARAWSTVGNPFVAGAGPAAFVTSSTQASSAGAQAFSGVVYGDITLGPNTGIVLSALTDLGVSLERAGELADGSAGLMIFDPDNQSHGSRISSTFVADFEHTDIHRLPFMQISFDNAGGTPLLAHVYAYAEVSTYRVDQVPEPSTPALMLIGTAALAGWIGLRRRGPGAPVLFMA